MYGEKKPHATIYTLLCGLECKHLGLIWTNTIDTPINNIYNETLHVVWLLFYLFDLLPALHESVYKKNNKQHKNTKNTKRHW